MRKVILVVLAFIAGFQLCAAQSCDQFINAANGKKFVYDNLNRDGKPMGQVTYTSTKKDASTVSYHSEITDKSGKIIGSGDSEITCSGSSINVDMKAFMPPQPNRGNVNIQATANGKYLMYPLNLSPGQTLPDGSADIQITGGGPVSDVTIDIKNRKVDKQETVTTAAGSFNCLAVSYDITVKVKMGGIGIPTNMHVTEWFSTTYGRPIKTETYNKRGTLAGQTLLASIN